MSDFYVESDTRASYVPEMEDRVVRLEGDMRDVKSLLSRFEPMIIRIDATLMSTLPHLATKLEVTSLRSEVTSVRSEVHAVRSEVTLARSEVTLVRSDLHKDISDLRVEMTQNLAAMQMKLSDLPTRIYMWGVLGVLITAYGAGLAALAVLK